jgi:hypothetical protein
MYLLVIFIILSILLFIELRFDITSRILKKPKPDAKTDWEVILQVFGAAIEAWAGFLFFVLIGYHILFGIVVLVIKFLFEYNGLTHGYQHYIFLILIGLFIGLIPFFFILKEENRRVKLFFFFYCIFFVTFIVILDEFLIYAIENRNLKQEVTGIIKGFFIRKVIFVKIFRLSC